MPETEKKEWVDWLDTKTLQKAAVMDEAGNVLSIRRVETGPGGRLGKWDLPGGSIGPEDLVAEKPTQEAIKREVFEETNLEVVEVEPIFFDSWTFTRSPGQILGIAIGYRCKVKGVKPEVKLSNEHLESKWGTKEEILALDFGDDGGFHPSIVQKV